MRQKPQTDGVRIKHERKSNLSHHEICKGWLKFEKTARFKGELRYL